MAMKRDEDAQAVRFFAKMAVVPFTGIVGTGSIFALRHALVRDTFTLWVFWLTTICFGVSAAVGIWSRVRMRVSRDYRPNASTAAAILIALTLGLIGSGILSTIRNWK